MSTEVDVGGGRPIAYERSAGADPAVGDSPPGVQDGPLMETRKHSRMCS